MTFTVNAYSATSSVSVTTGRSGTATGPRCPGPPLLLVRRALLGAVRLLCVRRRHGILGVLELQLGRGLDEREQFGVEPGAELLGPLDGDVHRETRGARCRWSARRRPSTPARLLGRPCRPRRGCPR